jgi:HEAT repeat protein
MLPIVRLHRQDLPGRMQPLPSAQQGRGFSLGVYVFVSSPFEAETLKRILAKHEALHYLIDGLGDPGFLSAWCAETLDQVEDMEIRAVPYLPRLREALSMPDAKAKVHVARAVLKAAPGDPAAIRALLELNSLKDESAATDALGLLGKAIRDLDAMPEETVAAFRRALIDPSPEVRQRAGRLAATIGRLAKPLSPALLAALADSEPTVRAWTAQALGALDPADAKEAIPLLRKLLDDPDPVPRGSAILALVSLDEDATPDLAERLGSGEGPIAAWVLDLLEKSWSSMGITRKGAPALLAALARVRDSGPPEAREKAGKAHDEIEKSLRTAQEDERDEDTPGKPDAAAEGEKR